MFISYSQNNEDIVLWRALGHISHGTYVDVGAADPTEYSVTKAFYDRGWSGVNVEPVPEFVEKLLIERPRDVTMALCAGESDGVVTLHHVVGTGLSTSSNDYLSVIADQAFETVDLEVEMQTLDRILESAGLSGRDIHFLKVDVEGAEESVLRGVDLAVWRPWVLAVEATEPLSTAQTHASWESLLLDNGYQFCLFDGLNRFYAADEHSELVPALSYPAGVFDQPYTVGSGQLELAARAEALIAERDALAESYAMLQATYDETLSAYGALHSEHLSAIEGYGRLKVEHQNTLGGYARLHSEHLSAIEGYGRLEVEHQNTLDGYARLHDEYESTLEKYLQSEAVCRELSRALETTRGELDAATNELAAQVITSGDLSADLRAALARLSAMEVSASWRLTRPLRALRRPSSGR